MALRTTPKIERSRERLDRIETAAREVIAEKGRDRFTTQDVADRAGVTIGALYRYFGDRVDILDHLYPNREQMPPEGDVVSVDRIRSGIREAYTALTDVKEQNPRERVRRARASIEAIGIDL
jgi:AcrR family transcriptional regulator